MSEAYIVRIGTRDGKRYAERLRLQMRVDHATGNLERLSDLALREAANDIAAEQARRGPTTPDTPKYDPFTSQYKGES